MAKEGIKSPDRADALLGCIGCGHRMTDAITGDDVEEAEVGSSEFSGEHVGGW